MKKNNNVKSEGGIGLAILIVIIVLTVFLTSCTEKPKVYRVGILSGLDFFSDTADGFKAKMTELGYIEGDTIIYDMQKTNFEPAKEKSILEKFIDDKVDLIFTFPTEVTLMARTITRGTDIPLLFAQSFVEGVDLIESMCEPGGNLTGVRYPGPDLAIKSLETLIEIAPQAKRIWIPYLKGYPNVPAQLEAIRPVAESLGVTLVEFAAASPPDVVTELQARAQSDDPGIDAIMTIYEPIATLPDVIRGIITFALEHKLRIGNQVIYSIIVDNIKVGEQAAPLADKILKGTPAGTIPVTSASPILVINYSVAQELGLAVPESLLQIADKIIR